MTPAEVLGRIRMVMTGHLEDLWLEMLDDAEKAKLEDEERTGAGVTKPKAKVVAFSMTNQSSVRDLQPAVYKYLQAMQLALLTHDKQSVTPV